MAAARRGQLGGFSTLYLLIGAPRLIPDILKIVAGAVRAAILDNNSLISLLDSERARRAVPDAATGVGWYDERPFLESLRPYLGADVTALELGCGGGRISRHVAPEVRELVATDASRAMVAEARENLAALPNVRVAATDGFTLEEFGDGQFDLVFGQGIVGYLDPNPALALLDEVSRVLKPRGVCVFNFLTIDHRADASVLLDSVRRQARARRFHGATDRAYSLAQIGAMYELAGLRVIEPESDSVAEPGGRVVVVGRA